MQSLRRCTRALTSISRLTRSNYQTTQTIIRKSSTINIHKNAFLSHFHNRIRENGDENALIFNNHEISYTQLYQSSLQCAMYLKQKHNIKEGDVISVIAKNIPQAQNIMIACQYLNAVYFPINGNLPKATIDYYNDKVNTKLIVTDNPSLYSSSNNNPNVIHIDPFKTNTKNSNNLSIGDDYMLNTNLSSMENEIKDIINTNSYDHEHNGLMMQTSGSTALPKIVVHSAASTNGWIDNGFNPLFKSTALLTSQSYHVSSYFQLMSSVINGGCIIYPSKIMLNENATQKEKCLEMLRLTDLYDIETVGLVVTPVYELVKLGLNFGNSVKALGFGGDIIPAPLLQRFMRLHVGNDTPPTMVNAYGSTEAGMIGMSMLECTQDIVEDLERITNELTYLNKMPNVKHRIDEETGELYVKSNSLMRGYYGDTEKTKEAFTDDGYYKTGDTVHVMEDCDDDVKGEEDLLKFMVVSRNKQVIVGEGGKYIFPQYIENELLGHDMVSGAVVVGIDCKLLYGDDCCYDENVYKYPVAFVRTNKKLEKRQRNKLIDELMVLCKNRNENEVPFKIFLVDDIPRVHIGKVDRNKLEKFANEYFKIVNENKEMMKKDKVFTLTVSNEMAGQFSV